MPEKKKSLYRNAGEIVLAFAVAWLFYQGLAFALGTQLPVVSVVSESMFHNGMQFGQWWESAKGYYVNHNINKEDFISFPFSNGLAKGDMLVIIRPDDIKPGDVVIYQRDSRFTIIHRVIAITEGGYIIKGDNNAKEDPGVVKKEQILGKAIVVAPLLGYPRIALFALGV